MTVQTRDQFVTCLKKSRAMDDESIDSWLSLVTDDDPRKIASKLVRDKLLTSWQAKFLLSGRSRLTLGNYRLLSRINSDELGDRFEAIHSQLGRKVVIQIFPSSIGTNDELRGSVLKVMQELTELDHPQLVHVYDVDQEGDRFFLVNEYIDGTSLANFPRGDLKDISVARIVKDITAGIEHAHASNIIHGNITQENVLVETGGQTKLQGLSTATVRSIIAGNSGDQSHQQDYAAIARIGQAVLKEVPAKRRGDGYESLVELLASLAAVADQDLSGFQEELTQWISRYTPEVAKPSASSVLAHDDGTASTAPNAPAAASASASKGTHSNEGSFDSPIAAVPMATLTKKKKPVEEVPQEPEPSFLSKLWHEKKGVAIGGSAALLAIIGATVYFLFSGGTTDEAIAKQNAVSIKSDASDKLASTTKNKKKTPKAFNPKRTFKAESSASGAGALSGDRPADGLDPEATRKKFEAMYAAKQGGEAAEQGGKVPATSKRKRRQAAAVAKRKAAAKRAAEAKPEPEPKPNSRPPRVAVAKTPPADDLAAAEDPATKTMVVAKTPAPEKVTPKAPSKKKRTAQAADGNPFAALPETVDLPSSDDTTDFKIADLTLDKKYLMGLELLSGPEISKSKLTFALERSATDKQLWDVTLKRRSRDDPTPVAQIQKTPTELKFRWLPTAADLTDANFIRNCKLKLSAGKEFGWLGLRSLADIENFRFPEDKTSVKAEIDLKWLPNPNMLKISLLPFRVEKDEKVNFLPREVAKKSPGIIFFRDKDDLRFFFIEVSADARAKLRMQAEMFVISANGTPQPLKRPENIVQFAQTLENRKNSALTLNQQAVSAKRPSSISATEFNKQKKKISNAADLATLQATTVKEYVEVVQYLTGRKIPFEIYFEMEGHQITLARSSDKEKELIKSRKPKE